jgi:lipopolysaccharide biosynthesis regulator YciM
MTFMAFLLLIILFLVSFLSFWGLNPQDITVFYFPAKSVTYPAAFIVAAAVMLGLVLGYLAHLYSTVSHMLKHWQRDRAEKKAREVAAIYREGVGRLLSGDIKKAHSLLQKALDRDPARVETHIAMASVRQQEGEPQEALRLLRKARTLEPKSLEVLFKLAAIHEEVGEDEEAALAYQGILSLEGDNRKALRGLRDLQVRHARWKEALELQKRILKTASGSRREEEEKRMFLCLRYEVARLVLEQGEAEKAESELRDLLKEAPDFTPAQVTLGDALCARRRGEEAVALWQEGYQSYAKSIFLLRLEDYYMAAEDPATLLNFYRSRLLERGDDLMFRLFYGKLCLRLEMVEEALEQLDAVESSGVEFPHLHLLLAEAHRRRHRPEEAIREYQKALGVTSRLQIPFVCESCSGPAPEWASRCQSCGSWGTIILAGREMIRSARPVEIRAIHHGEREAWRDAE